MAAARKSIFIFLFLISFNRVHSESLFERSYEYVMNFGKTVAPSLMSIFQCFGEEDAWNCAKERAGKLLDSFDSEVNKQRKLWQEEADAEVAASGRSLEEMPSKLGQEVEESLNTLTRAVAHGVARALSRKHSSGGGIESITIAANQEKKEKKKKQKPAKIHVIHPVMMNMEAVKGGDDEARGVLTDLWGIGGEALDVLAEDALKNESKEDGIEEKSSLEEQRGKKKKKKKAILKLLILGAVIKAKIGTILAILSYKLQLKFFLLALIGLGINLARLWIEIKNKHNHQPQKVIYYEHAQHQHHYDHEEENHGWGPWSRSIIPEEQEVESEIDVNSPYRGQEANPQYNHPRSS